MLQASWTETDYDRVAGDLVARGLGPIAIVLLESGKPLSFVGSQFLIFLDPIVQLFTRLPYYPELVHLLEDRTRLEQFIQALERAEEAHGRR